MAEEIPTEAVKEPCNDCPWRRVATPGWLGPYDAERWCEIAHSDTAIACHKTIKRSGDWDGTKQCRGAAIFRANVAKSPRDSRVVTGPPDSENIFSSNNEFITHHKGGLRMAFEDEVKRINEILSDPIERPIAEAEGWHFGERIALVEEDTFNGIAAGEEGDLVIHEFDKWGTPVIAFEILLDGSDYPVEVDPMNIEGV